MKTLAVILLLAVFAGVCVLALDSFSNTSQKTAAAHERADLLATDRQWAEAASAYDETAQLLRQQRKYQEAQVAWALAADAAQNIPDLALAESYLLRAEAVSPQSAALVRTCLRALRENGRF